MSLKALSYVWAHSQAKGATFVVHLALADYANEGGKAWPSIESLATKCRLSTRAVLNAIQELSGKLNAVSVEKYASPHRTHLYTMNDVHSEPGSQCTTFTSTVNDVPIHSERRSPNPIGTTKNRKKGSPSLRSEASASHNQVREEPISGEEKRPPLSPPRGTVAARTTDADFITELKKNVAYRHIDIDRELGKMDAWLSLPKNRSRKKTRQFVLNWLNRIEAPMQPGPKADRKANLNY